MRVPFFIAFVFDLCSCFQIPTKSSYSLRTTLHDHHFFYIDVYNDIKNALVPHDVYSTVAAETANIFVSTVIKKRQKSLKLITKESVKKIPLSITMTKQYTALTTENVQLFKTVQYTQIFL